MPVTCATFNFLWRAWSFFLGRWEFVVVLGKNSLMIKKLLPIRAGLATLCAIIQTWITVWMKVDYLVAFITNIVCNALFSDIRKTSHVTRFENWTTLQVIIVNKSVLVCWWNQGTGVMSYYRLASYWLLIQPTDQLYPSSKIHMIIIILSIDKEKSRLWREYRSAASQNKDVSLVIPRCGGFLTNAMLPLATEFELLEILFCIDTFIFLLEQNWYPINI